MPHFYVHPNFTAYSSSGPLFYGRDQAQDESFTPANGYSAPNNMPRSLAGEGDVGYFQNNINSVPRSQGDMLTHGRLDHDAWQEELDGGLAQYFAPSVRPLRFPDPQCPSSPPPPYRSSSQSVDSPSDSTRAGCSEALLEFTKSRRKKPAIWKCDFKNCSRDFTTKANRNYHKNAHFGIKPYHCDRCGRDFGVGHSRKRHLKTCVKKAYKTSADEVQRGGVEENLYPMLQLFPLSTPGLSAEPSPTGFDAFFCLTGGYF